MHSHTKLLVHVGLSDPHSHTATCGAPSIGGEEEMEAPILPGVGRMEAGSGLR